MPPDPVTLHAYHAVLFHAGSNCGVNAHARTAQDLDSKLDPTEAHPSHDIIIHMNAMGYGAILGVAAIAVAVAVYRSTQNPYLSPLSVLFRSFNGVSTWRPQPKAEVSWCG